MNVIINKTPAEKIKVGEVFLANGEPFMKVTIMKNDSIGYVNLRNGFVQSYIETGIDITIPNSADLKLG